MEMETQEYVVSFGKHQNVTVSSEQPLEARGVPLLTSRVLDDPCPNPYGPTVLVRSHQTSTSGVGTVAQTRHRCAMEVAFIAAHSGLNGEVGSRSRRRNTADDPRKCNPS